MSENTALPVHPNTGLQAIGFTRRGPVWPVMGASEPPAEGAETEPKQTQQQAITLPDDHPLVKTLAANKTEIKELKAKAQRLDEIEEAQKPRPRRTPNASLPPRPKRPRSPLVSPADSKSTWWHFMRSTPKTPNCS